MTPSYLPDDAHTTFVVADRPPALPEEQAVDIRPGAVASFDGARHHVAVRVSGPGAVARSFDGHETEIVMAAVERHLRQDGVSYVRFGDRTRFGAVWSAGTLAAVEGRLAGTVRDAGATLVTWTGGDRQSPGAVDYDVVVSR
jgi:hypothetical protein